MASKTKIVVPGFGPSEPTKWDEMCVTYAMMLGWDGTQTAHWGKTDKIAANNQAAWARIWMAIEKNTKITMDGQVQTIVKSDIWGLLNPSRSAPYDD